MAIVIVQLWGEVGPLRAECAHSATNRPAFQLTTRKNHAIEVRTNDTMM